MIYAWVKWSKHGKELPYCDQRIVGVDTHIQSEIENVMCALGYGVRSYFLLKEFRGNDDDRTQFSYPQN